MSLVTGNQAVRPVQSVALPQIPSLTRRLVFGGFTAISLIGLLVIVPYELLLHLAPIGLSTAMPFGTIVAGGVAIALLSGARYATRPTSAYGPVSIWLSGTVIAYLLVLLPRALIRVAPAGSVSLSIGYTTLVLLLVLVPALGLAAGVLTTWGDWKYPGERIRREYPTRPPTPVQLGRPPTRRSRER